MNSRVLLLIFLITFAMGNAARSETLVFTGGILIDVSDFGRSGNDIDDAIIIVDGDRIAGVGTRQDLKIPADARIIDVTDRYILPGLIDGYAALDDQGYANAYLYLGVTSIVGCYGYRRHPLYTEADPGPNIYLYGDVGHNEIATEEMFRTIDEHAREGVKFLNLMYGLTPEQVKSAVEKAHELGLPTIGEFSKLSYEEALDMGVDAILHFGRYDIEMAPPDLRRRIVEQPHGPAFREFRMWLSTIDPESDTVREFAEMLGSRSAALIPTLSIAGVDAPFFGNVWQEPAAGLIDPESIDRPVDQSTGKHFSDPRQMEVVSKFVNNILRIEEQFYKAGARYLAGSGNDINGTMPGISLHQEIDLLTRVGLSNREAIAAATSNFADILGWDEVGQIRPGRRADILIVDQDPLEDIKHLRAIEMVFLGGRRIDREKLLQLERDRARPSSPDETHEQAILPLSEKEQEIGPEIPGLGNPKVHEVTEDVIAVTGLYHSSGGGFGTNAGILFTSNSVVFIDAGMSIASAEFLWNLARERMRGDERLYLILTHHHADHVFGMRIMEERGASVIAHRMLEGFFLRFDGPHYKQFLAQRAGWNEEKRDRIFGDVILTMPDETVDKDTVMMIDGEEVRIFFTPGHVIDELSIYHPKSSTLFTGDAIYEGSDLTTHFGGADEWKEWIAQLERLKRLEIKMIVPGHGDLCGKEEIDRNIAYLKNLLQ